VAIIMVIFVLALASCARGRPVSAAYYHPSLWPVEQGAHTVTSPFGYRNDPFAHERRVHCGVDLAAPKGSCIVATAYGRVMEAGRNGGYGKSVLIDHGNGYQTLYAHLSKIGVKRGKRVKRGQVIGRSGETGRTTAPHLHYEVGLNGQAIDPRPFLP